MYLYSRQMLELAQAKRLLRELAATVTAPEGPVYLIPISFQFRTNAQDAPVALRNDPNRTDPHTRGTHRILEFGGLGIGVRRTLDGHVDLCGHQPVSKVIVDLFAIEQMQFHRRADGEEPLRHRADNIASRAWGARN